ncbi:MAG: hypothetical protein IH943_06925 [Acidobacteria bacterium]|nr:hypothetical protein [Acidobacteriota bacterium]
MKTKRQGPTAETETAELTAAQVYQQQLQAILDTLPEKTLELLAADVLALTAPPGARKIEPKPLPAVQRQLGLAGRAALDGWTVMPPMPGAAEFERPEPSESAKARAAQVKRLEDGSVYELDMRVIQNEDRIRAGLTPFPEPDEAEAESEPEPNPGAKVWTVTSSLND